MTDDTELDEILTRCFSNYSDEVAYHIAEDIAEAKQALIAWSERRENIEYHNGEKSGYADWQYLLDEELGIKAETPEQAVAAIKEREAAAPTENTGDEGLREKIERLIGTAINKNDKNYTNDVMALIRQDRRELLERLIDKRQNCYDCVHEDENMNSVLFISETTILDELQHGAESGEA